MIRQLIEIYVGKISDELFREAAGEATNDIVHNRLVHGTRTCFNYMIYVMVTYIRISQKIEKGQKQIA